MAWSGFGQMNLVQKQTGVQETSNLFVVNTSEPTPIRCELNLACLLGQGLVSPGWPFIRGSTVPN